MIYQPYQKSIEAYKQIIAAQKETIEVLNSFIAAQNELIDLLKEEMIKRL
jgi:uncharacterized coiled-coil protein SlyX